MSVSFYFGVAFTVIGVWVWGYVLLDVLQDMYPPRESLRKLPFWMQNCLGRVWRELWRTEYHSPRIGKRMDNTRRCLQLFAGVVCTILGVSLLG